MAFLKSFPPAGKKPVTVPGPNSAAYKKIVAAKKSAASAKRTAQSSRHTGEKRSRSGAAFSSLKSRQMLVERIKREIWASVLKINDAIISLALAGNFNAAKALFDFAGVYSLPTDDNGNAAAGPAPAPAAEPATHQTGCDPVDAFFRSIGVPPSPVGPEPGLAGQGL
jgi:hypothetical protein